VTGVQTCALPIYCGRQQPSLCRRLVIPVESDLAAMINGAADQDDRRADPNLDRQCEGSPFYRSIRRGHNIRRAQAAESHQNDEQQKPGDNSSLSSRKRIGAQIVIFTVIVVTATHAAISAAGTAGWSYPPSLLGVFGNRF